MATGMKLYDRLFRHAVRIPEAFDEWERNFRNATVFELTDCAAAIWADMNLQKTLVFGDMPKKPPGKSIWCEWTLPTDQHDPEDLRFSGMMFGVHLRELDEDEYEAADVELSGMYLCKLFTWIPTHNFLGASIRQVGMTFRLGWSEVGFCKTENIFDHKEILCVPFTKDTDDKTDRKSMSIPPMAFGMLNCRNIVTEDVKQDKLHQKVKGEREHRPFCTYKILKLEVPRRMAERQGDDVEGSEPDEPKMRFHLCRGHFKNLQHERYKQKGWHWWPAHWKGNIELGLVDKSYKLETASA